MFLSENNYQLPRRAQTWSGWSALSQKLNHTAVNAVGSCYWIFAHVCVRVARCLGTRQPQCICIYTQGAGVQGQAVGVTSFECDAEVLLQIRFRVDFLTKEI